MKVIWVHTFNPSVQNSGVFMHEFLKSFKSDKDVEVELFYLGSIKNITLLIKNIFTLFKTRHKYDIIHCQYGSFCSLACSIIPKKKIVTLRGSDLFQLTIGTTKEKLHSKLAVFFTKLSIGKFDKIIVMSKQMQKSIPPKYLAKTVVITDPIDLDKFSQEDKALSRKKIFPEFGDQSILILFTSISSNNPIKRFELAKSAVEKLNANSNIKYNLVAANNFPNSEMKYAFSAVDVCLLTSIYEGWPNCIKESLACNTPFVSTAVSDLSDIASQTQNCFVCADNIDELAAKISLSVAMPKEDLRSRVEYLSLDNTKQYLINLYQAL